MGLIRSFFMPVLSLFQLRQVVSSLNFCRPWIHSLSQQNKRRELPKWLTATDSGVYLERDRSKKYKRV
jgi:hypothetical protein